MNMTDTAPLAARAEMTIGRILLDQGKLTVQDAEQILRLQKEQNLRFGEAAIQLGLIKQDDIQQVLALQFNYPYLAPGEGGYSQELVAAYAPFSPQVESLRALRSQLMLRWFLPGNKALTIVGANPDDGASYLAANLAIVFSQLGERTLLIDANLRTPCVSGLFNLSECMGLSDVMADRADLSSVVRIPAFVDLSVLPAGTLPPNPMELLSRSNLVDVLAMLANRFDVILIDAPPANLSVDFQSIAARAKGAIISVRKNHTRLNEVAGIKSIISSAGAELVGAVLYNR